jgi:hypothetical protein
MPGWMGSMPWAPRPSVSITREPITEGPASGKVVRLDEMLPSITAPGVGTRRGQPEQHKLAELNL